MICSHTPWKRMQANRPLNGVSAIESHFTGIVKEKLLEDVDGTAIQFYHFDSKTIKVCNDFEIDAVYVDSEIELGCVLYE